MVVGGAGAGAMGIGGLSGLAGGVRRGSGAGLRRGASPWVVGFPLTREAGAPSLRFGRNSDLACCCSGTCILPVHSHAWRQPPGQARVSHTPWPGPPPGQAAGPRPHVRSGLTHDHRPRAVPSTTHRTTPRHAATAPALSLGKRTTCSAAGGLRSGRKSRSTATDQQQQTYASTDEYRGTRPAPNRRSGQSRQGSAAVASGPHPPWGRGVRPAPAASGVELGWARAAVRIDLPTTRYRIDTDRGPVTTADHPCSGTAPHHRRPSGPVHLISGTPTATGTPLNMSVAYPLAEYDTPR